MPPDLSAFFDASPNAYVVLDPQFRMVAMNAAYLRVTARRREDLLGRSMFEAFRADASPGSGADSGRLVRESIRRCFAAGESDHLPLVEYWLAPTGAPPEQRFWSATHTPLRDAAGHVSHVLQHTVDVTELHRLRQGSAGAQESDVLRRAQAVQRDHDALTQERTRLRALFEQAPGFMAVLEGPEHRLVMSNAAHGALLGHRPLLGLPIAEAVPELAATGLLERLDTVVATGTAHAARQFAMALDPGPGGGPEVRHLDFVLQPILRDGVATGIFVQGHDVTEQRRAEDALQESEERFRLVAENAPVPIWMSDERGACLYLNAALRRFWGVAEGGGEGFDWGTTIHPEDLPAIAAATQAGMARREGFCCEGRFRRHDGAWRVMRTEAQPRLGADGRFLGMIGVNLDLTETRGAEAALRQETAHLGVLNRALSAIAAELELDRLVQAVTDAGVALSGAAFGAFFYNAADEEGERFSLYALSGAPRESFEHLGQPRITGLFAPSFRGEAVVRSDDLQRDERYGRNPPLAGMPPGHLPVRSYLAVPVVSRSGEVLGALLFGHPEPGRFRAEHEQLLRGIAGQAAIAIDNARLFQAAQREIRQRSEAEEKLRELNETLEARVAAEIHERRHAEAALAQARRMEALGKLTGGVAHDFNNLLHVISGNLQLLSRRVEEPRARRQISHAMAGVQRGAKLAAQLLAFGRRQPLAPKVVSPGRLILGMEDMLRRSLGEAVEIVTVLPEGLWNTLIDPGQMENALLNLAINARDAMEGHGRLTIALANVVLDAAFARAHPEAAEGEYVVLSVSDTGAGMSPEVQARAFEPFFSTKGEGKGTGLGLSMVYGFLRQSGGHAAIESTPGQGSTFRLYLPRAEGAEEPASTGAEEEGPVEGGRETILVAEDDEAVRATVVAMLAELGYRVLQAPDAAAALEIIEGDAPVDLVFTDVVMPGPMRSTEMVALARASRPTLPVLYTSGYTDDAILHEGRLDEGVELLSKPYTREALAWKLRQMLAPARATAP